MSNSTQGNGVTARVETLTIPTYSVPPPDRNPMFLEWRVYQGASGRVYPNPLTDHMIPSERVDRPYEAVVLENEYIQVILLPEIGGRIFGALDKTNDYNFLYRQHVVKPALIGLFGPWISGGMEFNWPLHHRPSTFMPHSYLIEEGPDGSRTVWMGEHDPMQRLKGMVGICLYPGKALIETKVRIYNRTPYPQTFLWWENAAVHTNDQYQVFFPPDVTYVTFHSKQDMAHWPIARSVYCGLDYTRGVDISWYKNSPHATSFFAGESKCDFFGGYDHGRDAGVIHVANHHISPGKKLFTWGSSELARAWENRLTDADGPYIELMAGVYTDNQPDFSWLQPYETRTFSQFWYPIQKIGAAKSANLRLAVNLECGEGRAKVAAYATEALPGVVVSLQAGERTLLARPADLKPGAAFIEELSLPAGVAETDLLLRVVSAEGQELIWYAPARREEQPLPTPMTPPPPPSQIGTVEELYLTGLHLEQYRHPTLEPERYWEEGLQREPGDARTNNALGLLWLRRGALARAEAHLRAALKTLTRWNLNPYDGEPSYNLGLALKYQGRLDDAYAALYKATWNYPWQAAGFYAIAEIDCLRSAWTTALEHLGRSLAVSAQSLKGRNLRAAVLRRLGRHGEAQAILGETVAQDPLDLWSRNEVILVARAQGRAAEAEERARELAVLAHGDVHAYLDVALDYANAGLWNEASDLLERLVESQGDEPVYPMVLYSLAYLAHQAGDEVKAQRLLGQASQASPDYCFPSRLEEMAALRYARAANPADARAPYYLGNLLYDKKQYEEAIEAWEASSRLDPGFATTWRNLGLAFYNVRRDMAAARACYLKALAASPDDPRLFYEFDLLEKRVGTPPEQRLARLEQRLDLVAQRDVLWLERVALYNQLGEPEKALELLAAHSFLPWEGGEAAIADQYATAQLLLGRSALAAGDAGRALERFVAARNLPRNLGVGRWHPVTEVPYLYYRGLALEGMGDRAAALDCYRQIAASGDHPWSLMTLPELPYYQALALRKLGDEEAARARLQALLERAGRLAAESGFATSLPSLLPFGDDPRKVRQVQSAYLKGLAELGLGRVAEARSAFQEVLALDRNHMGALQEMRYLPR